MTVLLSIIIGILAGILGAILGIGGGVIMLPMSGLLLGFEPAVAVGTTLFAVFFTAVSGAYGHYKNGNVRIKDGLLIGAGGVIGLLPASWLFKHYLSTDTELLEALLGLLFLFFTFRMAADLVKEWQGKSDPRGEIAQQQYNYIKPVLLGSITGAFSGILGIGGGFIMVPGLLLLIGSTPIQAVGTSLFAMIAISGIGGLIKLNQGFVVLPVGILLGAGTIIGAQIGVRISNRIRPVIFKGLFTLLFLCLAVTYLI
ncbi:MAG TPA: sulfite exporter TauE/SafE family protein [Syntrophomonadaceae bacterium]|nr:sulfite exporter TauE/SafE family protein [Syntrophomonadaceae bacterium]HNX28394.1 sulfite exporter TauE/SafE family protein [Syntrophomonadaceae bacterium]HPR92674.1 sulfite exporter TauE/SafE family protein [Syntrophomonadaceae bacterium]